MTQPTEISAPQASRGMCWTGWTLSGLVVLFLTMDCVMKLLDLDVVKRSTSQLGYPLYLVRPIGLIELACLVVYALPRTSVLGAILLTGLFGGAISSHLRLGDPLFTHVLFGVYVGVLAWGGLWLRSGTLRSLIPLRRA